MQFTIPIRATANLPTRSECPLIFHQRSILKPVCVQCRRGCGDCDPKNAPLVCRCKDVQCSLFGLFALKPRHSTSFERAVPCAWVMASVSAMSCRWLFSRCLVVDASTRIASDSSERPYKLKQEALLIRAMEHRARSTY